MALIFNATNETQTVKAMGNFFTFKPKQVKNLQDNLAHYLATDRSEAGLVSLPEEFEDSEYRKTEEGVARLAEFEQKGIDSYVNALRKVIYNNQVSLRQDLEKANIKVDPATLASDGEIEAMRLVAQYQKGQDDRAQKRADEVKKLMEKVGPVTR